MLLVRLLMIICLALGPAQTWAKNQNKGQSQQDTGGKKAAPTPSKPSGGSSGGGTSGGSKSLPSGGGGGSQPKQTPQPKAAQPQQPQPKQAQPAQPQQARPAQPQPQTKQQQGGNHGSTPQNKQRNEGTEARKGGSSPQGKDQPPRRQTETRDRYIPEQRERDANQTRQSARQPTEQKGKENGGQATPANPQQAAPNNQRNDRHVGAAPGAKQSGEVPRQTAPSQPSAPKGSGASSPPSPPPQTAAPTTPNAGPQQRQATLPQQPGGNASGRTHNDVLRNQADQSWIRSLSTEERGRLNAVSPDLIEYAKRTGTWENLKRSIEGGPQQASTGPPAARRVAQPDAKPSQGSPPQVQAQGPSKSGLNASDERWIAALPPDVQKEVRALTPDQVAQAKLAGTWNRYKEQVTDGLTGRVKEDASRAYWKEFAAALPREALKQGTPYGDFADARDKYKAGNTAGAVGSAALGALSATPSGKAFRKVIQVAEKPVFTVAGYGRDLDHYMSHGGLTQALGSASQFVTNYKGPKLPESVRLRFGEAFDKYEYHHLVMQTADNVKKFGERAIHSTDNLVPLQKPLHQQVNILQNTTVLTGQRWREWVMEFDYDRQYDEGIKLIGRAVEKLEFEEKIKVIWK